MECTVFMMLYENLFFVNAVTFDMAAIHLVQLQYVPICISTELMTCDNIDVKFFKNRKPSQAIYFLVKYTRVRFFICLGMCLLE